MLPTKPPRNYHGDVVPHDHPDIGNTDNLIRGISPNHLVAAATPGKLRLSSMAFSKSSGVNEGMSCDLERLVENDGRALGEWIKANSRFVGGVKLSVGAVRGLTLMVGYDPITRPVGNPYHCQVWGAFPDRSKKAMLAMAEWIEKPLNVE